MVNKPPDKPSDSTKAHPTSLELQIDLMKLKSKSSFWILELTPDPDYVTSRIF